MQKLIFLLYCVYRPIQSSPVAISTQSFSSVRSGSAPSVSSTTQTEQSDISCNDHALLPSSSCDDVLISGGVEALTAHSETGFDGTDTNELSHFDGGDSDSGDSAGDTSDSANSFSDTNFEIQRNSSNDTLDPDDSDTEPEFDFEISYDQNWESVSDSDDEEMKLEDDMLKPIYEDADITVCGAYCAIMEFKRACHLPFTTIAMLLQLLQLLCPKTNKLPKSIHLFKKFFEKYTSKFQRRQFCCDCKVEFRKDQEAV